MAQKRPLPQDDQQFCLKYNDFSANVAASFKNLKDDADFSDVTIACGGEIYKCHKMVLSACSPYFRGMLLQNPAKNPIIIVRDVTAPHMKAIIEFMYEGEVNVEQEQLPEFLKAAERLDVKGLAEGGQAGGQQTVKQEP